MKRVHPALLLALCACASTQYAKGPGVARGVEIARIDVAELGGTPTSVTDPKVVRQAAALFRVDGWEPAEDNPLHAHYRVTLHARDGRRFEYLLGTWSDPPRAPCFAFCTGFWAASPQRKGVLLSLATSGDLYTLDGLLSRTR
jgi:hypothetical protein